MPMPSGTVAPSATKALSSVFVKVDELPPIDCTAASAELDSLELMPVMVNPTARLPLPESLLRLAREIVSEICSALNPPPGMEGDRVVTRAALKASWCEVVKDATVSKPWMWIVLLKTLDPEVGVEEGESVGMLVGASVGVAVGVVAVGVVAVGVAVGVVEGSVGEQTAA
jgi:hypothetical protein